MNNLELIEDLIKQAEQIAYRNGKLDAVGKRAEMLLRKIFGDNTHYLKSLKDIKYSPSMYFSTTPDGVFEISFNKGKQELLNLLNVIAEDLKLDATINLNKSVNSRDKLPNSKNIFIVHGHNEEMKLAVARTIEKLKLNAIILHEQPSKGKTIIEKFTDNSEVVFAIVLLSADDIAYNKKEKPENAKFRTRQNVIFELGYFIGKLGRERVLAVHEIENNFEIPSDYSGVLFVPFDKSGKWQFDLVKELKALGVNVNANDIL
jgi:Predicted nucleotide-binding protein containing TIR -like domain